MTTSSTNYTGLYSGNVSGVIPNTAYGNANVVSLLAESTDGANTVGNISATGNITGVYFLGNGSQLTGITSSYGNANVATFLAGFGSNTISTTGTVTAGNITGGNVLTGGAVSATGNVTGGNMLTGGAVSATGNVTGSYILGNGSQLTGVAGSYGNANVVTLLAGFGSNTISTTGNVTGGNMLTGGIISATGNIVTQGYFIGTFLGNIVGNLIVPGANTQVLYNNNGNADASAGFTFDSAANLVTVAGNISGGNITTAGNVTGNYILGNGSQLTGLPANYGNANVVANLAALGTNPVSTTGNITASYFIGNGALLTSINASNIVGAYGNAQVATFLNAFGSNVISTTGNVNTGNLNVGIDAVITGNLTVQGTTTTVNSNTVTINDKFINVANNAATAGDANGGGLGVGPVGSEYATLTFNSAANAWNTNIPVSVNGNVTAGYFSGNGSLLTSLTGANVTGTVANATYATNAGAATTANTVTDAAQANITSVGTLTSLSVSGNTTTGNLLTGGIVSATGNITGNYFLGNGSQLSGLPSTAPGGSNTQVQFNDGGAFAGNANVTFDKVTGNFTVGNIVTLGSVINSSVPFAFSPANTLLSTNNNRIIIGNSFDGNASVGYDPQNVFRGARLAILDKQQYNYTANSLQPGSRQLVSYQWADLLGTTIPSTSATRLSSGAFVMNVGNGTSASTSFSSIMAIQAAVSVGNANTSGSVGALGNATVNFAAGQGGFVNIFNGSTANNAIGTLSSVIVASAGGAIGNSLGFVYSRSDLANSLSTYNIGYFHPDNVNLFGAGMTGNARLATNYYAFYNKDNFADTQLGSLRSFHYFTSNILATGGSLAISKANGQYQTTTGNLTANLDVTSFTNFATSNTVTAGTNTGTKLSSDVVTLLVPMGATPYSINMPTGNASIRYVGNISTVTGTANSMVQVQITGSNVGGTTQYLVNIDNSSSNILTDGLISATGNITGGNIISLGRSQAVNFSETVTAFGNATGTITPNISLGAIQTMTLTGNITLNAITNIATGQSMTLILTQDGTGGRTLTSSMLFASGTKTLSTAAAAKDIVVLFYDGSTYYASLTRGYA